jgi:nucleotide sugar dehydrogenase
MRRALSDKIKTRKAKLCVVGLGYVGLPTAVFFAEKGFNVIGCDIKGDVVKLVSAGKSPLKDLNIDGSVKKVVKNGKLTASTHVSDSVRKSDVVLITVPTPTGRGFEPDLQHVISAGESVRAGLKRGHLVILESTVYPGVTEEILKPILEKSGLKADKDFGLAYCPERYNPGDSAHTIDKVLRIVGATNDDWAKVAAELYEQVARAVVVKNIKTAEMAKIIENTQRDLNIALMNEIALICERIGIDIMDVIDAAATKWNFKIYLPGAGVGGHCLPKDPWYLVKAAERVGYHAQVITAGRKVNDSMPHHMFELLQKAINETKQSIKGSTIVVLGLSYKEGIGDTRNSPALGLIRDIKEMGGVVRSVDPYVDEETAKRDFGVDEHVRKTDGIANGADAIVIITAHKEFKSLDLAKLRKGMRTPIIIDGRRAIDKKKAIRLGFTYKNVGSV